MLNMTATIDEDSGFCFGVTYAIEMAEEVLKEEGRLYCLGDIVHNDEEVKRLVEKGLKIIDTEELKTIRDAKVLIRAHGEPPETYMTALANNIELIDASCPVVLKLQNRVKESFDDDKAPILIYGKHGHAEVKGLLGQTLGEAKVFTNQEELDQLDLPHKVKLFSQTTKSTKSLYGYRDYLKAKGHDVEFNDTICRQVSNRDVHLQEFVKKFDVVIFVAGTKSSNGKILYDVCKLYNNNSYFVSNASELNSSWFKANYSVGICGATSTPFWQMLEVQEAIEKI
ncbi:MAG: 4-hydroxy-3-methylbut-2-enyl diphosphate reductase [Bacteroidetes bacterium]|nr:4-hydroxy-3-methylbut-2-enyl diphosphate reductase [Bacteroidota bacterium]